MNRVFSGVQPTGNLHLGNYLGAIRHWVKLQDSHECIYGIMDLHAITVPQDPAALRKATREVAAALIASGVDPQKSILFPQSAVSVHAELAWILGCHTPLGWLNRMTQFKEKAGLRFDLQRLSETLNELMKLSAQARGVQDHAIKKYGESIGTVLEGLSDHEFYLNAMAESSRLTDKIDASIKETSKQLTLSLNQQETVFEKAKLGLYAYPVLMAADILGYKATHVPVGEDQKQHLELARDIAGAFNRAYGREYFPLPEPLILGEATRVMSLRDGRAKMSKSDASDMSRINLTDDADMIANKIRKAKSDMVEGISYDPENRPEVANLLNIFAALSDVTRKEIEARYASSNFAQFKKDLTDLAVDKLAPLTAKMRVLLDDPANIDAFLQVGAEKANDIASKHLAEVKDIVGFFHLQQSAFR